jgi:TolB-like protein
MDAVGYSRLVAEDEEGTLHTLGSYRKVIADLTAEHGGRIFGSAGDSFIIEFSSAVEAVRCGVAVQRALHRHNADLPERKRLEFRIGINVGDVVAQGTDLLGDGVNVAARLQEVAERAGLCISRSVREQVENKLSFAITPLGERSLKNIPRPVQVYRVDWRLDDASEGGVLTGNLLLPDRPSIAVLPFANMSGDAEQEYFVDGISEDIITALSQYRWFFVIARNSTFIYKGRAVDVKQVAREQGVRYVLEGSVRKSGNRVRITGQLIDAATGNHLWAQKYDRDLADIFAVQDEITQSVVSAIEPEMLLVEARRASRKAPGNLDAFDCYVRGMWFLYKTALDDNREAIALMRKATELDGNFAQGHMGLARAIVNRIWYGWSPDVEKDVLEADVAALRAVALDERDPYSHYAAFLTSILQKRHQQALDAAQRSIDLTPNFALGHFALGATRIYMGKFAEAVDPLLRCVRLNPQYPQISLFWQFLAVAQYHLRNYNEALRYAEVACGKNRLYVQLRILLACLGQLGRMEEGKAVLAELEALRTADAERLHSRTNPYVNQADREHFFEGLRKAGMRT